MFGSNDDDLDGDLDARFIPLSEVTGCTVTQILHREGFGSPESLYACRTRWAATVRDGSSVQIPWRDSGDPMDGHEAFAHEMIELLTKR